MAENSSKNLLNTRSHVLRSSTPAKKIPADGNLAILDDICQQVPVLEIYQRYSGKSPERLEKHQNTTSYHLKNLEKLWVNVSFKSPIVLGVQYQGVGNFKTI